MRPIDADALIANIKSDFEGAAGLMASSGALFAVMALKSAPTLTLGDLRPHGCWNIVEFDKAACRITIECSTCGMVEEMSLTSYALGHNFCHSCGAMMDLKEGGSDA